MPRTKIVCTIGPASDSPEMIRALIQNGMSVARLNFSHGTHQAHQRKLHQIRKLSEEMKRPVAILQDLCGPKIRVGRIPADGLHLVPGQRFTLTGEPNVADQHRLSVSYADLPSEVRPGDPILLADGFMELVVEEIDGVNIHCRVITGGLLTSHKGVNLPAGGLKVPSLTDKDKADLLFGLENDVDYVALSFVRSAGDISLVKDIMAAQGKPTPVVAKIEKHEAVEHIDDILEVSDGLMVARGDLGVEIPLENVPNIQKRLIRKANQAGKPVIIATQMLRSMVDSPRPTRAEAADVANGVLDGADAMMLSEETAMGQHPVEAVRFMTRIAQNAEKEYPHARYAKSVSHTSVSESVAHAACILAGDLEAGAIVATTRSGLTARHISRFSPEATILALSPDRVTVRRLALFWGCEPLHLSMVQDTDEMIEKAAYCALTGGRLAKGQRIVITAGRPAWAMGTTNMLWVKTL